MEHLAYLQGTTQDLPEREGMTIQTLIAFPRGFAFSVQNVAHVFEKDTNYKFLKRNAVTVVDDDIAGELP